VAQPNFLGDFIGRAANDHAGARFDETPRPVVVEGVPGRVELMGSVGSFETGRTLPLAGDGDPPDIRDMEKRVAAVEEAVGRLGVKVDGVEAKIDGVKTALTATLTMTASLIALTIGLGMFLFNAVGRVDDRVTRVEAKIDELPGKLNESIREANRAFSDAVNTSLQVFRDAQSRPATPPPAASPAKP